MIYTYFGGMDGLMDEYVRTQDFWVKVTSEEVEKMKPNLEDGGREFIEHMLFHSLIMYTPIKKLKTIVVDYF